MAERLLKILEPSGLRRPHFLAVDGKSVADASEIMKDIQKRGEQAVREHAARLGDIPDDAGDDLPLVVERSDLERAWNDLDEDTQSLLERTAARIASFAKAQRSALTEIDGPLPGGRAGHTIEPVERAGCYAPGGRYPLVSSALMTAVTARCAGVKDVIVATPRPGVLMLGAAWIGGADRVLIVGGAQAIGAMQLGVCVGKCDVICGPGNKWVTAAKFLASSTCAIDMIAGPSELLVLADDSADASTVAADLLAQAEHDADASAVLISTSAELVDAVERELHAQLESLPTADTARRALANGCAVVARSIDEAIALADEHAPEHLEIHTRDADAVAKRLRHAGALFIGHATAEVFGDYGAGPNHTLPTGGTARHSAGLSVLHFLRVRTWLRMDDAPSAASRALAEDAAALARLEGLEAHARSAEARLR